MTEVDLAALDRDPLLVVHADCVEAMASMAENSVDAITTDPPYGFEFMGKSWDKLDGADTTKRGWRDESEADRDWIAKEGGAASLNARRRAMPDYSAGKGWRSGGGFTKPGLGDRPTEWASYGAREAGNATCAMCGGRMRGARKCACEKPEWRVDGEALDPRAGASYGRAMQEWHYRWAVEALRVLKPGGYLLAFGGTRTYHRLASAIEDAGFEVRDTIAWVYAAGFPKSLNVSKAIDKAKGADRVETRVPTRPGNAERRGDGEQGATYGDSHGGFTTSSEPVTDLAKRWSGWGTALKPAFEPIVVARKPLRGTVAGNVELWGTGALNIDATRIAFRGPADEAESMDKNRHADFGTEPGGNAVYGDYSMVPKRNYEPPRRRAPQSDPNRRAGVGKDAFVSQRDVEKMHQAQRESMERTETLGRWPANVALGHGEGCAEAGTRRVRSGTAVKRRGVGPKGREWLFHDLGAMPPGTPDAGYADPDGTEEAAAWDCEPDCPIRLLDEQSGDRSSPWAGNPNDGAKGGAMFGGSPQAGADLAKPEYRDIGGASRFFFTSKAGSADRSPTLSAAEKARIRELRSRGEPLPSDLEARIGKHPTVKPVDLMRWLVRLVAAPGAVVLDPFAGSGTTGQAALAEGMRCVLIEREAEYVRGIIEWRGAMQLGLGLDGDSVR